MVWDRNGQEINLRFLAGFVGFKQDPETLEICPNVSWCIAKCMSDEEVEEKQRKRNKMFGW